jgi:hypothetical protein
VSIDYAAQELEVFRLVKNGPRPIIHGGKVDVANEEPLRRELADFVESVRSGRKPGVTGHDGRWRWSWPRESRTQWAYDNVFDVRRHARAGERR